MQLPVRTHYMHACEMCMQHIHMYTETHTHTMLQHVVRLYLVMYYRRLALRSFHMHCQPCVDVCLEYIYSVYLQLLQLLHHLALHLMFRCGALQS
jgi:hypothetical protein